jgi:hypothetical protein
MKVSGQLHAPAKELLVHTGKEAGWVLVNRIIPASAKNQTLVQPSQLLY